MRDELAVALLRSCVAYCGALAMQLANYGLYVEY